MKNLKLKAKNHSLKVKIVLLRPGFEPALSFTLWFCVLRFKFSAFHRHNSLYNTNLSAIDKIKLAL